MKIQEFLNKPVETYLMPDTDAIFRSSDHVSKIIDLIIKEALDEFLVVYLENDESISAILSYKQLPELVNKVKELSSTKSATEITVGELNLKEISPIKIGVNAIKKDQPISVALAILKNNFEETLAIINTEGRYIGKVTRSKLRSETDKVTA